VILRTERAGTAGPGAPGAGPGEWVDIAEAMAMSIEQQLAIYLTDAHAIEVQALAQVERAPRIAGDPEIAAAFADHARETERHRRYVEDRLMAMSWAPVPQKDLAGKVSGIGMALFARFQPDTPGKLVAHAYSYERMELALYDLLERLANRAGDADTALTARMIGRDERAMAERLTDLFDRAVEASLRGAADDDLGEQLNTYLADAHAIEEQALQLLSKAGQLAGADELGRAFERHREQTQRHVELVEDRLRARGASPSALKDAALRLGAVNLGWFFKVQPDTPAKLAAFAYAFEHLEIAAYELLRRVAARAQDEETVSAATTVLVDERSAAGTVHDHFDEALEASLVQAGVTT
jgi:ferritin-like metal-binding protein YciE